ncbi:MAG: SH3-like domain-containing protein [Cyanobacteria bacterium P01_F01_bin.86]
MNDIPPKSYHQQIPHDPEDHSSIPRQEKDISYFEKLIVSLHNLMRTKKQLPSFDAVRRAAEEVDGLFAAKDLPADIPSFLRHRLPEYGERRVLAVETVLCELGYVSRDALSQEPEVQNDHNSNQLPFETDYAPTIDKETYREPRYLPGDLVQVATHSQPGHIRTPVYLLGKKGTVIRLQGMFLNPEDLAHFKSQVLQLPLYLVEFEMLDVWGDRCPARSLKDKMRIEIYEPWLFPIK